MIKRIVLSFIAVLMIVAMNQVSLANDISIPPIEEDKPTMLPYDGKRCTISCFSGEHNRSKALISLTGRVVTCVRNTLDVMFDERCVEKNILKNLQAQLKNAVYAALMLYIVLLGIKITASGKPPSKQEIFTAILKFGFVLYFTIGSGLNEIVYQGGRAAMSSLSNFLIQASTGKLCYFSGYERGYEYLAMWDTIDCRIGHYLFIGMNKIAGGAMGTIFGVFCLIIPLLFSLQIMLGFFLALFGIFVISIATSIVHFFILAMIGLALMTYFGVIFVPMVLFSFTKKFFENWWTMAVSFTLQPVVMSAFIAFPFLIFDYVMYADCDFIQRGNLWFIKKTFQSSSCMESLGYQLNDIFVGGASPLRTIRTLFFDIVIITWGKFDVISAALLKILFFCYLFMLFAEQGGDLAARITDGPAIGGFATNAGKVLNDFINKITKKPEGDKKGGDQGGNNASVSGTTGRTDAGVSVPSDDASVGTSAAGANTSSDSGKGE
jgi:type IV secretion system protein VirB6